MVDISLMDNLSEFVLNYPSWSHVILALGIVLQGELTVLLSMYLIANGDLTWFGFIAVSFVAFFIAETFLYFLGRYLKDTKTGEWLKRKIPYGEKIENYIQNNAVKVIVIAKFIIGSTIIVMFLTGWSQIKFKEFIKAQILSVAVWLPPISVLAYGLVYGLWYLKSTKVFSRVEIGIAIIAIIMLGGEYILKKIFKAGISLEEKAEKFGKTIEKNTKTP